MSRARRLRQTCAEAIEAAAGMRFVREVSAGTIGEQAFANYLLVEESFVETAARLHGLAIWQAPRWSALERSAAAAHALTTEQIGYFRKARARWPVPARLGLAARHRAEVLAEYTTGVAREHGFPAVITALFAAETLYSTWCVRAHQEGAVPSGPIADWVALHARDPFLSGVADLAAEVDQIPETIPDEHLADWFTGTLDAEITFHDAVFDEPETPV